MNFDNEVKPPFIGSSTFPHKDKYQKHLLGSFNVLSLKTLEATLGDVDIGDEGVELVHRVLVLVPQPGEADAHAEGNAPDTLSRENEKVLEFRDEVTRRSPGPRWPC